MATLEQTQKTIKDFIDAKDFSDIYNASFENFKTFREKVFQHYLHRVAVFINGFDVTNLISGGVSVSYGELSSTNSLSFSLVGAYDSYIMNSQDVDALSEAEKSGSLPDLGYSAGGVYDLKNHMLINKFNPAKKDFSGSPVNPRIQRDEKKKDKWDYRFTIRGMGTNIFNKYDPVVAFIHNPLCGRQDSFEGSWFPLFAGFLTGSPLQQDFMSGLSTASISCSDIRELMSHMRVSWTQITAYPGQVFDKGIGPFLDSIASTMEDQGLIKENFVNAIRVLLTGKNLTGATSAHSRITPVGRFSFGSRLAMAPPYGEPDDSIKDLNEWHDISLFGEWKRPLTTAEMQYVGMNSGHDGFMSPLDRKVFILTPRNKDQLTKELFSLESYGAQSTFSWNTRDSVLSDLCDRAHYTYYVSPFGDIVVEPFLGDIEPKHFGAYKDLFTVDAHIRDVNIDDEASIPPAVVKATGGFGLYQANLDEIAEYINNTVISISPVIAMRYGPEVSERSYSYINAGGGAEDEKHAIKKILLVEHSKEIANSASLDASHAYRLGLLPNRPLHVRASARIGRVSSVSHSYSIGSSVESSSSLDYVRCWDHNNQKAIFVVNGAEEAPLSFRTGNLNTPGSVYNRKYAEEVGRVETVKGVFDKKFCGSDSISEDALMEPFKSLYFKLKDTLAASAIEIKPMPTGATTCRSDHTHRVALGRTYDSRHLYGWAVDIIVKNNARDDKLWLWISNAHAKLGKTEIREVCRNNKAAFDNWDAWKRGTWLLVAKKAAEIGIKWGGTFNSFFDGHHFQLNVVNREVVGYNLPVTEADKKELESKGIVFDEEDEAPYTPTEEAQDTSNEDDYTEELLGVD